MCELKKVEMILLVLFFSVREIKGVEQCHFNDPRVLHHILDKDMQMSDISRVNAFY